MCASYCRVQEKPYAFLGGFTPTAYVPPKPESERKTWLPFHVAFGSYGRGPEAVIKALLAAYPDAAKEKSGVRCGRGRVVPSSLLSSYMRSMPSPPPLLSLASVQDGYLPKDYADTDAIKALLAV